MKLWTTLVRREFWENRSLWIAPLAAAVFLAVGACIGIGALRINDAPALAEGLTSGALAMSVRAIAALILLVGGITQGSYLLDCLYAERKDRSILFWKSLPVSDTQTVLSKFLVAMVVLPLGLYLLSVATHLFCTMVVMLRLDDSNLIARDWSTADWLAAQAQLVTVIATTVLWYVPVAAYLMLASVFARRAPMLTAVLPPIVLALGERMIVGSSYVATFLVERLSPAWEPARLLASPSLWSGLVFGAVLLLAAIRLRRYRDDT